MSVEGPESHILATQMTGELACSTIATAEVHDVSGLQRSGFVNADLADFDRLVGGHIDTVIARGNTIHVDLDNDANLIIGPEYGGRVLLHEPGEDPPARTHLVLDLDDGRRLSVRLTGMGVLRCDTDEQMAGNHIYARDFSGRPDPVAKPLSAKAFETLISTRTHGLKTVLVGKDAVLVGLSNSAFQDILHRAGLHPKRKASELSPNEQRRLHRALCTLISERMRLGGKHDFVNLYGQPGRYQPAMGPTYKDTLCPACDTPIEALSLGGGRVYYCPTCQC